jgi:hypothetical protein
METLNAPGGLPCNKKDTRPVQPVPVRADSLELGGLEGRFVLGREALGRSAERLSTSALGMGFWRGVTGHGRRENEKVRTEERYGG